MPGVQGYKLVQLKGVCKSSVTTSAHTAGQLGTFLHDPITHYKAFSCTGTRTPTHNC